MTRELTDAEVFRDPTGILPMGGGYDWRCYVPRHGLYFLCKDGLPLRDSSKWNPDGWRVCAVEVGREEAIKHFAAYVASLQEQMKEAVEILQGLGIGKKHYDAGEVYEATKRAETFLQKVGAIHG